jgi:glycosyltransferase involved in cell wall biosynthesis
MNRPLVSIVTPVFNQEKYIESTINSVLSQTYSNIEYIVIDDGSYDGTREVLDRYKS